MAKFAGKTILITGVAAAALGLALLVVKSALASAPPGSRTPGRAS